MYLLQIEPDTDDVLIATERERLQQMLEQTSIRLAAATQALDNRLGGSLESVHAVIDRCVADWHYLND